ncbi:VCBS repeat-containing protein, partial [bacterium]|nr:VCBS repeat-containing protein [bacterium]
VGDLDGDGNLDLATSTSDGSIVILWGDGTGAFPATSALPLGSSGAVGALALADMNADRRLDLVVTCPSGFSIFLGRDARDWKRVDFFYSIAGETPSGLAVGDLSGDGTLDVVVTTLDAGSTPGAVASVFLGR